MFDAGVLLFLTGFLTNLTNKHNHKEHAGRPSVAAKAWLNVQEHRLPANHYKPCVASNR